jgi:hypothetical protein
VQTATTTTAIIVLRSDVLARIRQHYEADDTIAVFDAADAAPPVTVVSARAQMLLLVERSFAESPVGMEFLERFREAHPSTEIRVLTEAPGGLPTLLEQPPSHPAHLALRAASQPLRHAPGRRAPRVNMPPDTTAIVNGVTVRLVNISEHGAQVLSPEVLKPGEHVHARLPDTPRRRAIVVWSAFEMLRDTNRPGYRAGLSFG